MAFTQPEYNPIGSLFGLNIPNNLGQNYINSIGSFLGNLGTEIPNFINSIPSTLGNFADSIGNPIGNLENNVFNSITSPFTGGSNNNFNSQINDVQNQQKTLAAMMNDSGGPSTFGQVMQDTGINPSQNQPIQLPSPGQQPTGPGGQATSTLMDSYTNLIKEANQESSNYLSAHPFSFDDYLAGKATSEAHASIDPYYQQTLGYYLAGVTNQINKSNTNMYDVLNELNTSAADYTKENQVSASNAVVNTNENNEQSGMGSSGQNFRQQGQAQAGYGASLADYLHQNALQQAQTQHQTGFNIADIINSSNQEQQNLARQQQTDIQNRANSLATNAQQNWLSGLYSQPAISSLSGMGSGFNLGKVLGIG